jgi:hypothetical protein
LSRKLLAAVLTLVLAGWLQGCGPSGGEMTPATASTLQRDVDAVVSAADASRWDAAIDALDQLEADAASAQATGRLSEERAAQIRAVRQRVLEDLQRITSSPTPGPTTTTQTTPSTETNDSGGNDGQSGKSKGDGKGETAAASIRGRRVEPISSPRPGIRMIIAADAHQSGTCLAVSAAASRPPLRPCSSRPTARSHPCPALIGR